MRVAIIGGGIAGAAAARTLDKAGHHPILLEATDAVGGRTKTVQRDGFDIDSGAIFVMGSYARTLAFLREHGHALQMRTWRARTGVLDNTGRKHRVRLDQPWTLLGMPQLTWGDRLRAAAKVGSLAVRRDRGPFDIDALAASDDGSTLAQWSRRNLGDRAFEYVVRPLMDPLTGADPTKISAAFLITLMTQVQRTQLTVPDGGLGRITEWLLDGVSDVRLNTPATSLAETPDGVTVTTPSGVIEADAAVVATDVRRAHDLLRGVVDQRVTDALADVVPVSAHHIVFGYHRDPWPDAPFDLVVHGAPGTHHNYGVLLNGRRAPASVPEGGQAVSVWLDRAQTPGMAEREVVGKALEGVQMAFGHAPQPDFTCVYDMEVALIAPVPGHYAAMRIARDRMPARIRLAGDFLTHSGIEGALLAGERAAADLHGVSQEGMRTRVARAEL